jgi:pimeloyl-ACP methyl ester carboxylesterase
MLKKVIAGFVVFLLVLLLYATVLRKDETVSKADVKARYSLPNSHFINWNGCELHYTESGSGFPILMIHGFGGSNRDFYLLDSLLNNKYRVIRVDLPGFGLSDFPQQDTTGSDFIEVYNNYFNFLLDTLHLDSFYVMGNSLGGMIAWHLERHHPNRVKKMVLFNSAGYDMKEVMKSANAHLLQYKAVQMILKKGIPKFFVKQGIKRVVNNPSTISADKIQRVYTFWNREGNMQHLINMANSKTFVDQNLIKQVACPTLIVWGNNDKIVNVKYAHRFHADIKGSREIIYDNCGHVPMLENPLQVSRDVLQFLQEN